MPPVGARRRSDLGARRARSPPGRVDRTRPLRVGFVGSVYAHKGASCCSQAAQRVDAPTCACSSTARSPTPTGARLRALDRARRRGVCGRVRAAELPAVLAGVDVAALPSAVVGLRAAGRRRVPAPRACRCWRRRMGGLAEASATASTGWLFDGGEPTGWRARSQRLADRARPAGAPGRRASRRRARFARLRRRAGGRTTPASAPSRVEPTSRLAVALARRHDALDVAGADQPPRSSPRSATTRRSSLARRDRPARHAPRRRRTPPTSRCATSGRRTSTPAAPRAASR